MQKKCDLSKKKKKSTPHSPPKKHFLKFFFIDVLDNNLNNIFSFLLHVTFGISRLEIKNGAGVGNFSEDPRL